MFKILRQLLLTTAILLAITQISCNSNDDSNSECENVICTAILIRIMVSVTNQNQDPVALDSFQVINLENGKDITVSLTSSELIGLQEIGQYPLIEDGVIGLKKEIFNLEDLSITKKL
jgi:hypothetical protein